MASDFREASTPTAKERGKRHDRARAEVFGKRGSLTGHNRGRMVDRYNQGDATINLLEYEGEQILFFGVR